MDFFGNFLKLFKENEKILFKTILVSSMCYYFVAFLYFPSFQTIPLLNSILVVTSGSTLYNLFLYLHTYAMTDKNQELTGNILIYTNVVIAAFLYIAGMINSDINIWHMTPIAAAALILTLSYFITHKKSSKKEQLNETTDKIPS